MGARLVVATRWVRDILHDEMITALSTMVSDGVVAVVKKGSLLGKREPFDSAAGPAVVVEAPLMLNMRPVTQETSEFSYQVEIDLHDAQCDPATADDNTSHYECALRIALANYDSAAMDAIGWCKNTAEIESAGWQVRGQATVYHWQVTFKLFASALEMVTV